MKIKIQKKIHQENLIKMTGIAHNIKNKKQNLKQISA